MSTIDSGTLGWVKSELDTTIAQARACLDACVTGDDTSARMLANHVHQLVGTLQMVDLAGPAMFASEAEALLVSVDSERVGVEVAALLDELLETLGDYLHALEGGAPDTPIKYLDLFNRLRTARGAEALAAAALFNPDLTVIPTGRRAAHEVADSDYRAQAAELRSEYRARLPAAQSSAAAVGGIGDIVDRLLELARLKSVVQLWWVARAYLDWLQHDAGELDSEAQTVMGRIDQQLAILAEHGESPLVRDPPDRLIKTMLYRLATATDSTPRVAEIKRAFDLERLIGGAADVNTELVSPEALSALSETIGPEIKNAQRDLARYFESGQSPADLKRLDGRLRSVHAAVDAAQAAPLSSLTDAMRVVTAALADGEHLDREQAAVDMAASLLFVEKTLDLRGRLDSEWNDQLEARVNRLRGLTDAPGAAVGDAAHRVDRHELARIVALVARELRADLAQTKSALEAFAEGRDPDTMHPNAGARAADAITRARGALALLGRDQAAELARLTDRCFRTLPHRTGGASARVIDALAVALTAIDSCLDSLTGSAEWSAASVDLARADLTAADAEIAPSTHAQEAIVSRAAPEAVTGPLRAETVDAPLMAIFVAELGEHLAAVCSTIDRCKRSAADCRVSGELKRRLHTVAGSARGVELDALADAFQATVNLLDALRRADHPIRATELEILERLVTEATRAMRDLSTGHAIPPPLQESFSGLAAETQARARVWHTNAQVQSDAAENGDFVDIFTDEASDILARVETALRGWRSGGETTPLIGALRRELHTLKGGARAVGVEVVGELAHSTETLLDRVGESGVGFPAGELLELLEEVHDGLQSAVSSLRAGETPAFAADLNERLKRFPESPQETATSTPSEPLAVATGDQGQSHTPVAENDAVADPALPRSQVRVSPALLDRLVNYAGEISITRARVQEQFKTLKNQLQDLRAHLERFRDQLREFELHAEDQIRAHREEYELTTQDREFDPLEFDRYTRLQQLSRNLAESLDAMVTVNSSMTRVAHDSESVLQEQGHLSNELHGSLLRARMVPFGTITSRLRHHLRQTARELDKWAELRIVGEEVGVDRTILESMTEAFEHMIRNAVDHGIESPEERIAQGKPEAGLIRIECALEGNEVRLQFGDDGRGLKKDAIRRRAEANGLIEAGSELNDHEVLQLIVEPGFTTVDSITRLSGRGVGMDVVHSAVRRLGGTITVHSRPGEGASFAMRLPVSLAMTQAVFVRCGSYVFAISLRAVETISEVARDALVHDETTGEPLLVRKDHRYPLMNLTQRFGLSSTVRESATVPVLLARMGATLVAVQVDELVGTQEIVVKRVGAHLAGLEGMAGAAVRGDGQPILVLDVVDLWVSEEAANGKLRAAMETSADDPPLVMVVDDSLTVRKVTSRNLTRHGMRVMMAKDGIDALDQVRSRRPDIMLVDVEMPRMDGYELTDQIRKHPMTRTIPIIMVTSRAGEKHRNRALELGADAYITKPYHEDELVAEVQRLLDSRSRTGNSVSH